MKVASFSKLSFSSLVSLQDLLIPEKLNLGEIMQDFASKSFSFCYGFNKTQGKEKISFSDLMKAEILPFNSSFNISILYPVQVSQVMSTCRIYRNYSPHSVFL